MDAGPSKKRLHVGGLTPNITPTHIKDRFASFGTVHDVETLRPDALGESRRFTFLTIDITPAQLKKCMNIMSGSMWRGTQLRIAEAKLQWNQRLDKERNPPTEETELRIKKRRKKSRIINAAAGVGKVAQDMRAPTLDNYASKKFWTLSPSDHLVRPMAIRPTHPLPPPVVTNPSSDSGDTGKARPKSAPCRQRRRVINPLKWAPVHLSEKAFAIESTSKGQDRILEDGWEWEEAELEDDDHENGDDDAYVTVGRWRRVQNGSVVDEQVVQGRKRRRAVSDFEEEEFDLSDQETASETSGLFGRRESREGVEEESGSDLFARRDEDERENSPLFGSRAQETEAGDAESPDAAPSPASTSPSSAQSETIEDDEQSGSSSMHQPQSKSTSPLFPLRESSPPRPNPSSLPPPPSAIAASRPSQQSQPARSRPAIPEPLKKQVLEEQSRDLSLLGSILGGVDRVKPNTAGQGGRVKEPEWTVYDESDDEDEEIYQTLRLRGGATGGVDGDEEAISGIEGETKIAYKPLRLRGGAGGNDADMESDDESETASDDDSNDSGDSSDSDDESDSDSESSGSGSGSDEEDTEDDVNKEIKTSEVKTPAAHAASSSSRAQTSTSALKNMFAPTNNTTSTGFSLLADLDGDIELDDELDVPLAPALRPDEEELQPLPLVDAGATVKGLFNPDPSIPLFFPPPPAPMGRKNDNDSFAADREQEGWKEFWRQETDEEMKEIWRRDKLALTREWKQRHREAKKHRRRRGGVDEVE